LRMPLFAEFGASGPSGRGSGIRGDDFVGGSLDPLEGCTQLVVLSPSREQRYVLLPVRWALRPSVLRLSWAGKRCPFAPRVDSLGIAESARRAAAWRHPAWHPARMTPHTRHGESAALSSPSQVPVPADGLPTRRRFTGLHSWTRLSTDSARDLGLCSTFAHESPSAGRLPRVS
jgi:hypothetical protein